MTRRSPRQRDIDDQAFPIRVKVAVPRSGFGNELNCMYAWLRDQVGRGDWAQHPGRTLGGEAMAFYFRRVADADRFLEAFPLLELADGTMSRAYTSPLFPFGRASRG